MLFLNEYICFLSNQFGFCSNMSTINHLFKTSHFICSNLDKKFRVLGIFQDFTKAFDSINHDI